MILSVFVLFSCFCVCPEISVIFTDFLVFYFYFLVLYHPRSALVFQLVIHGGLLAVVFINGDAGAGGRLVGGWEEMQIFGDVSPFFFN